MPKALRTRLGTLFYLIGDIQAEGLKKGPVEIVVDSAPQGLCSPMKSTGPRGLASGLKYVLADFSYFIGAASPWSARVLAAIAVERSSQGRLR